MLGWWPRCWILKSNYAEQTAPFATHTSSKAMLMVAMTTVLATEVGVIRERPGPREPRQQMGGRQALMPLARCQLGGGRQRRLPQRLCCNAVSLSSLSTL